MSTVPEGRRRMLGATTIVAAIDLPGMTSSIRAQWARLLISVLGAYLLLVAVSAAPTTTLLLGIVGGVVLAVAPWLTTSPVWRLTLILLATLPFAALTWTSVVTPTIALLAIALWFPGHHIGIAAHGTSSYRSEYRREVAAVLAVPMDTAVIRDADLAGVPVPVAAYLRLCGVVGEARVVNVRARLHGRIRAGASSPWIRFAAEQVNTYGPTPSRLFLMHARMYGLPVQVLHLFLGPSATMRVRLCSLLTMVNAAGPDLDRGETVTLLNDLCVLAPAALVGAPIGWQSLDPHRVRAELTNGIHTVSAELVFNDDHELTDFVSDDRSRASADGRHFTQQRWSTPLSGYRAFGARRLATYGEGRWHAPDPEGEFSYLEMHVDEIDYNVTGTPEHRARDGADSAPVSGRR